MHAIMFLVAIASVNLFAALSFTEQPSIQRNAGNTGWTIGFAVSESTDVEITVLKASDSSVVRRLAAGRLGANPPAPFTVNSLSQAIEWDGRDELGATVDAATQLMVRVRAGMNVWLDGFVQVSSHYFSRITGAAFDDDGNLMVWGVYGLLTSNSGLTDNFGSNMGLRMYDNAGEYLKTVFPFPGRQPSGPYAPWRIYRRPDSTYCPTYITYHLPCLVFTGGLLSMWGDNNSKYFMMPFTVDNKAMFFSSDSFSLVSSASVLESSKPGGLLLTTGTPLYVRSADKQSWYATSGANNAVLRTNVMTTQTATWHIFPATDTVGPTEGIALDAEGRLYVCDRARNRICVYDTASWARTGVMAIASPYRVQIDPATGALYVLSKDGSGSMTLSKVPDWHTGTVSASIAAVANATGVIACGQQFLLTTAGAKPVLAVTYGNVKVIRDDGDHFTVTKDFNAVCAGVRNGSLPSMYERVAVDRRKERVYTSTGNSAMYKVLDWQEGIVTRCTTSARTPLNGAEMAVGPDDFLYAHMDDYSGPIKKFTTDDYPAPSNFGTAGSNIVDAGVAGRHGPCAGDKGIAIRRDGCVADIPRAAHSGYFMRILDPANPTGSRNLDSGLVFPLADHGAWMVPTLNVPYNVSNVKFDFDGNIYIGSSLTAPNHVLPRGYPMVPPTNYRNITVGSVNKFPPTGGSFTRTAAVGALKIYSEGFSIMGGGSAEVGTGCICRSPRFDLDPWGRLFIPNALLCEVYVTDNNDNRLVTFGEYGNADSRAPGVPFATPMAVASSDDYIYIADPNDARLLRVRMQFQLDNLPSLSPVVAVEGEERPVSSSGIILESSPNPFNPVSRIAVSLPSAATVRLGVYDVTGKLIRTIVSGARTAGFHSFVWDGKDHAGRGVAAGLYVYRLEADGKTRMLKTIMAK